MHISDVFQRNTWSGLHSPQQLASNIRLNLYWIFKLLSWNLPCKKDWSGLSTMVKSVLKNVNICDFHGFELKWWSTFPTFSYFRKEELLSSWFPLVGALVRTYVAYNHYCFFTRERCDSLSLASMLFSQIFLRIFFIVIQTHCF